MLNDLQNGKKPNNSTNLTAIQRPHEFLNLLYLDINFMRII